MNFRTLRYQLVEQQIPVGFTGNRIKFDDQPNLRNDSTQIVVIQSVEVFMATSMPITPSGLTVISAADLAKLSLVFSTNNDGMSEESIYQIPMNRMNIMQAAASGSIYQQMLFANIMVEFSKSYVNVAQGTTLTPGQAIVLGVHYLKGPVGSFQAGDIQQFQRMGN